MKAQRSVQVSTPLFIVFIACLLFVDIILLFVVETKKKEKEAERSHHIIYLRCGEVRKNFQFAQCTNIVQSQLV